MAPSNSSVPAEGITNIQHSRLPIPARPYDVRGLLGVLRVVIRTDPRGVFRGQHGSPHHVFTPMPALRRIVMVSSMLLAWWSSGR